MLVRNTKEPRVTRFRRTCEENGVDPEKTFSKFYAEHVLSGTGEMRLWAGEVDAWVKKRVSDALSQFLHKELTFDGLNNQLGRIHREHVCRYAAAFSGLIEEKHPDVIQLLVELKKNR